MKRKKLKIGLGILAVAIAVAGIWLYSTVSVIYNELLSDEVILKGGDKQALIIYQPSKHDTAKNLSMALGEELQDQGYTVTINFPSEDLTYDIDDYDIIAYGSPVYASNVSPVLEDYITSLNMKDKKVIVYAVGMLTDETVELDNMISWISKDNAISAIKISKGEEDIASKFVVDTLNSWKKGNIDLTIHKR
ncbi:flavodoxin family protein [Breznakia pachnodae]|uniref:Flavodoxin n=1 Tax=Breznakia pachnodae TaxID=265178 RepID=A0ABU0DYY2_9FIRM|nr:flavodoxin domain-containing protein [Breznakia pachnodae]MDQ0359842.1 flavodoxin [Breznakia pachnodae]